MISIEGFVRVHLVCDYRIIPFSFQRPEQDVEETNAMSETRRGEENELRDCISLKE